MHIRIGWPIAAHVLASVATIVTLAQPVPVSAAPPVVKTVPWVAAQPLIPHDSWSGRVVTLKGTSDVQGTGITYIWDFGDGSPVATGAVTNMFAIEATHAYTGTAGLVFTARLTVTNTATSESASKEYFVRLQDKSLPIEVNVAIDEGLWYLHKNFRRWNSGGVDYGSWRDGSCSSTVCAGYDALHSANVNAFFVNGHKEDGAASNPYTETVQRAMRRFFELLGTGATALQTYTAGTYGSALGTIDPDCTECGVGDPSDNNLFVYPENNTYEAGLVTTALAASGTPTRVATTGPANIVGRTYRAILQDMVDWFVYAQEDRGNCSGFGGWHYGAQYCSADNSTAQWGAIALLAAEGFGKGQYGASDPGIRIPPVVRLANPNWLRYSFRTSGATWGNFGYSSPGYFPWGPWATTPSGLVQLAFDGLGRGGTDQMWEKTEAYVHDNFGATGGSAVAIRDYYYGLYAFVKAMLYHVSEGSGLHDPITLLGGDLDWYAAEKALGASTDGVARTLVGDQAAAGYWTGHNYDTSQYTFETSWAIQMLNRTVTESGAPVAVASASPNPAIAGQTINLSGAGSFHQDTGKEIDSWEWDLDNNGSFESPGVFVTTSFPALGSYPVKLRVTDNGTPEKGAVTTMTIVVSTPPLAPTAIAGGPYSFCPGVKWYLNGTGSTNPDEGQSEPGKPGNTIATYGWELTGDGSFDDAIGKQPDVTAFFTGKGVGNYLIQLKVIDNTAASFPSSGMGDLSDTDSTTVVVRALTDPACTCVSGLIARAKPGKADLVWTPTGAHHYNVYRGTVNGGPYLKVGLVAGALNVFADSGLVNGTTYYWVVRPATITDAETCQSNQASATPRLR